MLKTYNNNKIKINKKKNLKPSYSKMLKTTKSLEKSKTKKYIIKPLSFSIPM